MYIYGLQPIRLHRPVGFSRQEYWSGLPCPSPGDLPHPGIEPGSSESQADSLPSEPPGKSIYINTHTIEYCLVTKKEGNLVIISNIVGTEGYYTMWNKSEREKQILCVFPYTWNVKNKANEQIKQTAYRYREQPDGCWERWAGDRQNRWRGLRGANFQL